MPSTFGLIYFVLLVAPGLLGSVYISKTVSRKRRGAFDTSVEAIFIAIAAYSVIAGIRWFAGLLPDPVVLLEVDSSASLSEVVTPAVIRVVLLGCFIALAIAALWSLCLQFRWPSKCLRKMRLTARGPFESHWDDFMHEIGRSHWVSIRLADGREFIGWIDSFSDGSEERSLSLSQVSKKDEPSGEFESWPPEDRLFIPDAKQIVSARLYVAHGEAVNVEERTVESAVPQCEQQADQSE